MGVTRSLPRGAQSVDGKAAYVQVYLAGDQGEALANESVDAVRQIAENSPAPPGVKAYVTGAAATSSDQNRIGDESMRMIELVTFGVIVVMLLVIYRSVTTTPPAVRTAHRRTRSGASGLVAFLGYYNVFGLTTFATNMVVTLAIAAVTDYGIFLVGRYHEARRAGEDRESAYYTMVSWDSPRCAGLRPDHRGRHLLLALHPVAVLPDDGLPWPSAWCSLSRQP